MTCEHKKRYRTSRDAEQVRARQQASAAVVLRIYPCDDCGWWHLTHVPMTPEQIGQEQLLLIENLKRYLEADAAWKIALKPVRRQRPYRARCNLEDALARQENLLDQRAWLWGAWFQAKVALDRSQAQTADEARRIDTEAMARVAAHQCQYDQDRARHRQFAQLSIAAFEQTINTKIRMPWMNSFPAP